MDFIFGIPIPFTWPETAACISALITILFGLCCYLAPRLSLKLLRLQTFGDVPEAVSEMRGTLAGFYIGVGVLVILFQQPMLYLALAAGWGVTAFGRLSSMILDKSGDSKYFRAFTPFNIGSIAFEGALAAAAFWPVYSLFF